MFGELALFVAVGFAALVFVFGFRSFKEVIAHGRAASTTSGSP